VLLLHLPTGVTAKLKTLDLKYFDINYVADLEILLGSLSFEISLFFINNL
jgi:hypothetical protein